MLLSSLLIASTVAGQLTAADVARHDQPDDCWLILNGEVYDVTPLISAHPGQEAILRGCGKDATFFFENRDEAGGHSAGALAMLPTYHLGSLGDEFEEMSDPAPPPPSPRLAASRLGHQATADVGPAKSLGVRVAHNISTSSDLDSGIAFEAGYSTGRFDIMVSDEQAAGIGSLQVKAQLVDQHGDTERPLSLALMGGAGMGYSAGVPVLYTQLVGQRDLLNRRLIVRANTSASLSPGSDDSGRVSVGGSVEFRPMPLHGVFASVQSPLSEPSAFVWNAGLSFYTRQHTFALYAASTPSIHPVALNVEADQALAIGFSLERAFMLGR